MFANITVRTKILTLIGAGIVHQVKGFAVVASSSVELADKAGRLLDEMVPNIRRTSYLVQEIKPGRLGGVVASRRMPEMSAPDETNFVKF